VVIFWFVWVMFVICRGLENPRMVSWNLFCFLFVPYVCYVVGELSAYPPVLTNNLLWFKASAFNFLRLRPSSFATLFSMN
jgi:hypothetical protein